ncbi:hypothetical protein E2C01_063416 [Portunus trituberculatus]|uniref:Uncharacterized protein n=1 Tax=Portunus trituberculatus TaxID=210409 RepID=A0A5B7H936_PORTR|nr:hypothetical protein [Portunus trituberculatus]
MGPLVEGPSPDDVREKKVSINQNRKFCVLSGKKSLLKAHHLFRKRDSQVIMHNLVLNQIRVHLCRKISTFINASVGALAGSLRPGDMEGQKVEGTRKAK